MKPYLIVLGICLLQFLILVAVLAFLPSPFFWATFGFYVCLSWVALVLLLP